MNKLLHLLLFNFWARATTSFSLTPTLRERHNYCEKDVAELCPEGFLTLSDGRHSTLKERVDATPLKLLWEVKEGYHTYPCLGFDVKMDVCLWHAFLENELKSQPCIESLQTKLSSLEKQFDPKRGKRIRFSIPTRSWQRSNTQNEGTARGFLLFLIWRPLCIFTLLYQVTMCYYIYIGVQTFVFRIKVLILVIVFFSFSLAVGQPVSIILIDSFCSLLMWFVIENYDNKELQDKEQTFQEKNIAHTAVPIQLV